MRIRPYVPKATPLLVMLIAASCATQSGSQPDQTPSSRNRPSPRSSVEAARCDSSTEAKDDFDGDGRPDRLVVFDRYSDVVEDEVEWIRVCTAAGDVDEREIGFETTVTGVIDIEPDGRHEMVSSGTTAYSQRVAIVVFADGALSEASYRDEPYLFEEGLLAPSSGNSPPPEFNAWTWGCADVNDDGTRELVQAHAHRTQSTTGEWSRRAYGLEGARLELVDTERGAVTAPANWSSLAFLRRDASIGRCDA